MVGMNMFETRKSSNIPLNKIPTYSMPNVNLIKHHNNTEDEHLLRTELSLNVFDYSYVPKRTLLVRIYIYTKINEAIVLLSRKNQTIFLCL